MNQEQRLNYLEAMGIQVWLPRRSKHDVPDEDYVSTESVIEKPCETIIQEGDRSDKIHTWDNLSTQVRTCTSCVLHKTRIQTVFGIGDEHADWMIIGEAPGAQEDQQGEPFVGRAGLLLNEILFSLGLQRSAVFIANILKCRPPNNRDPLPNEVEACSSYLKQQVELIAPRIILALGRIAAQNLLQTRESIGRLRGRVHYYQSIPVIVIYHPAYLLRSPVEKRKVLQDLILAQQTLGKVSFSENHTNNE
ncbi:MAG TPA: uracil-DNA glycosylase [Crenotrichaceae bacterium]|nr:uracil-DNA glycosylase [Crenotrichaceae bacterium]